MKSLYTAEYVLWKLQNNSLSAKMELYDGYSIRISHTLRLIRDKGCTCQRCGVTGTHFGISDNGGLNLFYENENGRVIFTKDHIIPKSKGGMNNSLNYELLCQKCNNEKANRIDSKNIVMAFQIDRLFHKWLNAENCNKALHKKLVQAKKQIKQNHGEVINEQKFYSLCNTYHIPHPPRKVKNSAACRVPM